MPSTTETARFDRPPQDLLRRLADFGNLAEWDPVFERSERLDDGPLAPGARFHASARVAGRDVPLTFVLEEYDDRSYARLRGEGDGIRTSEEIRVTPDGDGCEVTFASSIETDLPGPVDAALQPAYLVVGKRAIAGMKKTYGGD